MIKIKITDQVIKEAIFRSFKTAASFNLKKFRESLYFRKKSKN